MCGCAEFDRFAVSSLTGSHEKILVLGRGGKNSWRNATMCGMFFLCGMAAVASVSMGIAAPAAEVSAVPNFMSADYGWRQTPRQASTSCRSRERSHRWELIYARGAAASWHLSGYRMRIIPI
jgi:hypothetical protein